MIGIICVNFDAGGGIEVVSKRLCNEFNAKKHVCKIYSLLHCENKSVFSFDIDSRCKRLKKSEIENIVMRLKNENVLQLIIQLNNPFCLLADAFFYKLLQKENIKVYSVLHSSPKSFVSRYPYLFDGKIIFIFKEIKGRILFFHRARSFVRFASKNSTLIALSAGCKKEFFDFYGVKDVFVIPNPIDFPVLETAKLSLKKHVVIFLGRMDYHVKNFILLLNAWNCVKNKGDWQLLIVGSGEKKILCDYVERFSIDNVSFFDGVKNSAALMMFEESGILLQTSYYEGFPTIQCEAIAKGNAIITTRYDGYSNEIVEDGYNGFVSSFNAEIIAENIQRLIDDNKLLLAMQTKSLEKAKELKSVDVISLWEKVL